MVHTTDSFGKDAGDLEHFEPIISNECDCYARCKVRCEEVFQSIDIVKELVAKIPHDGIGGKPGWAWIFILEGLLTVLAGFASFWIIQDFPDTAKFLTEEERTLVIRRLQQDDQFSAAGESLKLKYIWQSLLDWKTWVGSACFSLIIQDKALTRMSQCYCTWGALSRNLSGLT